MFEQIAIKMNFRLMDACHGPVLARDPKNLAQPEPKEVSGVGQNRIMVHDS